METKKKKKQTRTHSVRSGFFVRAYFQWQAMCWPQRSLYSNDCGPHASTRLSRHSQLRHKPFAESITSNEMRLLDVCCLSDDQTINTKHLPLSHSILKRTFHASASRTRGREKIVCQSILQLIFVDICFTFFSCCAVAAAVCCIPYSSSHALFDLSICIFTTWQRKTILQKNEFFIIVRFTQRSCQHVVVSGIGISHYRELQIHSTQSCPSDTMVPSCSPLSSHLLCFLLCHCAISVFHVVGCLRFDFSHFLLQIVTEAHWQ